MPDHRLAAVHRLASFSLPYLFFFHPGPACHVHPGPFNLEITMNSSPQQHTPDAGQPPEPLAGADWPRFPLGQLLTTPGALKLMQDNDVDPMSLLQRHVRGDWGLICAEDAQANEEALICGARLLSSYLLPGAGVIWIITESDRSVTTCLRPDEY